MARAPKLTRRHLNRKRLFDDLAFDPRRAAVVARRRKARLKDLGIPPLRTTDGDMPPWLWLNPLAAHVPGKGRLELVDPSEVGQRWDTQQAYAGFDAIFEKSMPDSFEIVRPHANIWIEPAGNFLVDIDLWGNCFNQPKTAFRVVSDAESVVTVDTAQDDRVSVVCSTGVVQVSLDVPFEGSITKTGKWALLGVRVTPLG